MNMFGSFPPSPLVVSASKVYSGLGADIVYGIITLITAQRARKSATCVCRVKVYNPPSEGNHETLLFCTSACVLAREHALGCGRSFCGEMEAEHGEKQVHR